MAGVSEEALKKRLPQLAWGLARQGGPSAAQLARVAMLRLRPALLLEQLLQPQCLNARNAKVFFSILSATLIVVSSEAFSDGTFLWLVPGALTILTHFCNFFLNHSNFICNIDERIK